MKKLLFASLALALACAGPAAAQTKAEVPELVQQLKSGTKPASRAKAADALARLGPKAKDGIPVLIDALKETGDLTVPPVAVKALAGIGAPAVPALTDVLKHKDTIPRAYAAMALGLIGPEAKAAVPGLIDVAKAGKDPANIARLNAVDALGKIAPGAKDAVPALIDVLKQKGDNSPIRLRAAIALGRIGPGAADAVPALIDALKEPQAKAGPLCFHAATALGQIGPKAKKAVPALKDMAEDKNLGPANVVATEALQKIEGKK